MRQTRKASCSRTDRQTAGRGPAASRAHRAPDQYGVLCITAKVGCPCRGWITIPNSLGVRISCPLPAKKPDTRSNSASRLSPYRWQIAPLRRRVQSQGAAVFAIRIDRMVRKTGTGVRKCVVIGDGDCPGKRSRRLHARHQGCPFTRETHVGKQHISFLVLVLATPSGRWHKCSTDHKRRAQCAAA